MKKTLVCLSVATFLLLQLSVVGASDCGENADPCGKRTDWNEFETIRLRMMQKGMPSPATWIMRSSRQNGDLQVDIDYPDPKRPQRGTIMMVEGETFVSRGIDLPKGSEIDALDWPLLTIIMTTKVLSRALPNGPASIKSKQVVMHEDNKTGIKFATPSADGFIAPPWSVSGFVMPNTDGSFDFDLTLNWAESDQAKVQNKKSVSLAGQLKHNANFEIDSKMSLDGYKVFGVGAKVEKTATGTKYDYGAKPLKDNPQTIDDIRKAIAIKKYPGKANLSLNFAGFWKENCAQGFGLRIKPVDTLGMYTVTFCGPGGCGDESKERQTYITGDIGYNVVSATELQIGPAESRSTYKKCTDKMLP
jgi:hypothetical protein